MFTQELQKGTPSTSNIQNESSEEPQASNNEDEELYVTNLQFQRLQQKLQASQAKVHTLESQVKQFEEQLKVIFNADQIHMLKYKNHRGYQWSDETVQRALKLYMACGAKGYQELCKQQYPLPSIRTLQHRIQNFKVQAGVLEDIFVLLKLKVNAFENQEKYASLLLDEIAIKPGLQYDNSTKEVVGRPTMMLSGNKDSSNKLATHALVFMLAGMTMRWKQTVAYELTAASYSADEVLQKLYYIVRKSHDIGLTITTIISDIGPANRSFWRLLHITAGRHEKVKNYCAHPCDKNERLYVMPDPVHAFKNVATSLVRHKIFKISDAIKNKYKLPSEYIKISAIKKVFDLDSQDEIKMAYRLKDYMFQPGHFEKMDINTAYALFHNDTAAAITYYIAIGALHNNCATTAWFCKQIYRWFSIITSRSSKLGLSENNPEVYEEALTFLKQFMDIIYNITIDKGEWKPFQSGIVLATQTSLDLQDHYLRVHGFRFVLLGRLTQDALENLFSVIRSRTPVPGPHEFKVALRLITLSQYECQIVRGNYFTDNRSHLINYCKEKPNHSEDQDQVEIFSCSEIKLDEDELVLNEAVKQSLYYLLGSVIFSLKKKKKCSKCIESITVMSSNLNDHIIKLTQLKEYKENVLLFPKVQLFDYILIAETFFRKQARIIRKPKTCHSNIIDDIVSLYFRTRFFLALKNHNDVEMKKINVTENTRSSRSVAMRALVKNVK
ncbi:uncharacterized protein LOC116164931 [Photinus pyralis]|uniref:uncharacterized protein LOC116164931 n=1 Tax=Photinus pyralis TaxID=7054 RepID=UPI001267737E|nr:uncharacterized protein LOC116164931 [Photinus pyralis]